MIQGTVFSGIGAAEYAGQELGIETIFACEVDEYPRSVLKYHFPKAKHHGNIKETDFNVYRSRVDLLVGGFPCQDASIAKQNGKGQQGLEGERTGLWKEMFRAIGEIKPNFVLAENVANILRTNEGNDFRIILEGLSSMGYNAEWRVCRSSEVGGCDHRARVFLVAYSRSIKLEKNESFFQNVGKEVSQRRRMLVRAATSVGVSWDDEPPICWVDDGFSERLDRVSLSKFRQIAFQAYGNAINPKVIKPILEKIKEVHERNQNQRS